MGNIKRILTKLTVLGVTTTSILTVTPISAYAQFRNDSVGWWYMQPTGEYATGWIQDKGNWYYLGTNGYMKTGWQQDNNKWYYLNSDGSMAHDTTINGYKVGSDGAWIQNTTNLNSNNVTNTSTTTTTNNNSSNTTNLTNNINNGIIINGNVSIGNTSNSSNNTQQNHNNYGQINSNDGDKTEPIIEGKFTDKENSIFPCWTIINGRYYHLDANKQIDYNTIIDGYKIGVDGAWIQDNSINPPKAIVLPYGFQLNAKQVIGKLQQESKLNELKE